MRYLLKKYKICYGTIVYIVRMYTKSGYFYDYCTGIYILLYDHIRGKIKGYGTGKQIKMEN